MRIILTADERATIEAALADRAADHENERLEEWYEFVHNLFPWLRWWWEGMDEEEAVRALLDRAETEATCQTSA
jgi:hypothetical protein